MGDEAAGPGRGWKGPGHREGVIGVAPIQGQILSTAAHAGDVLQQAKGLHGSWWLWGGIFLTLWKDREKGQDSRDEPR